VYCFGHVFSRSANMLSQRQTYLIITWQLHVGQTCVPHLDVLLEHVTFMRLNK
jgi:hypothetical protein